MNTLYKHSIGLYNSSNTCYIPRFRYKWVNEFGWCVPTLKLIERLQRFAGNRGYIVFPAAGIAWLPMLVALMPCSDGSYFDLFRIIVTDIHTNANIWFPLKVEDGVRTASNTTIDDTMVISWAPDASELGTNMLKAFNGNQLIVIGEKRGGCTASESFFTELSENWTVDISFDEVYVLQWNRAHDNATFYYRNRNTSTYMIRRQPIHQILQMVDEFDITTIPFLLNRIHRLSIYHPMIMFLSR